MDRRTIRGKAGKKTPSTCVWLEQVSDSTRAQAMFRGKPLMSAIISLIENDHRALRSCACPHALRGLLA